MRRETHELEALLGSAQTGLDLWAALWDARLGANSFFDTFCLPSSDRYREHAVPLKALWEMRLRGAAWITPGPSPAPLSCDDYFRLSDEQRRLWFAELDALLTDIAAPRQ
jgi:hypothetical protein